MEEPGLDEVCAILDGVRNLRGLGLQLEFPLGDLNSLDEITDYKQRRVKFITRWRALNKNFNWPALKEALDAPQINCRKFADEISKTHLINASTDSAVSLTSPTSASSLSLPSPGTLPLHSKLTACTIRQLQR